MLQPQKMNRYIYACVFAFSAFILQLRSITAPHLAEINPHILASAQASLSAPPAVATLQGLTGYLLLGIVAHVAPMLLAARIHGDLKAGGPGKVRSLLNHRGTLTAAMLVTFALMVIANHLLFPQSLAFPHSDLLLEQRASIALIYGLPALSALVLGYWLVCLSGRYVQLAAAALLILGLGAWALPKGNPAAGAVRERPDLIVIGIDSLRPDHLQSLGYLGPSPVPTVDALVAGSVHFEHAYSPMARTFVAYTSVLTGQYPITHGARENLYPRDRFDNQGSIAHLLSKQGYETLFAMDEARFANFDRGFGFDQIVTPPPGVVDFVAGALLDTAGTNLLQLLPYADRLLPHVAGNRAAASTYRPEVHSARLARAVDSLDRNQPWLLVSHFCMAHWPYARGSILTAPPSPFGDSPNNYRAALSVADSQVDQLLVQLRELGRLDNAVVVLLSDHGEALGMGKDDWLLQQPDGTTTRTVHHGHGMPALDPVQSRVLLSFQRYRNGEPQWRGARATQTVSLVDVAPTLMRLAGVNQQAGQFDGMPLLAVSGDVIAPDERAVFLESGLSGTSLQGKHVDEGEVAREFGHLYRVTPDHRIELSPEEIPGQLHNKQRAIIRGRLGLSSNPSRAGKAGCWLTLDLETLRADCLPLANNDAAVLELKSDLCHHFASDREFHSTWCVPDMHTDMPISTP